MRARLRIFPAALLMMLTASIAALPARAEQEGHFDQTLSVTGAVDLDVQTGSGDIKVHAGETGKVEIHAKIHANSWPKGDAEARIKDLESNPPIEQSGNTIRVGHVLDKDRTRNISISYDISVPADTKLHAASGSGDQTIEGIGGPLDVTSGSGDMKVSSIGNEVHVRTGSGEIELSAIRGSVRAGTGSGGIRATGIAGGLNATSGSGEVKLEQTAAGDVEISTGSGDVEVKGTKGAVRVTTGSGSIRAQGDPSGEWRLHTGSGDVTVELPHEAAFDVAAHTSSGSIETSHEISVQGRISPRELHGKVHGGGSLVDVSTSSGSIEIK